MHYNNSEGLLKHRFPDPMGWVAGAEMCIANKLPGEADAVGLGSHRLRSTALEGSRQVPLLCTGVNGWEGVSFWKRECVCLCACTCAHFYDIKHVMHPLCAFSICSFLPAVLQPSTAGTVAVRSARPGLFSMSQRHSL